MSGHVDGAFNIIPAELLNGAEQLKKVSKDTPIVVYCRTGRRSAIAINILKKLGFTNLENGINKDFVSKNYFPTR